jgi:hypothetical protein
MKLVEIIPGLQTSEKVIQTTRDLAMAMGKTVTLSKDMPGFIANRLLMPFINEAIQALQDVSISLSRWFPPATPLLMSLEIMISNCDQSFPERRDS